MSNCQISFVQYAELFMAFLLSTYERIVSCNLPIDPSAALMTSPSRISSPVCSCLLLFAHCQWDKSTGVKDLAAIRPETIRHDTSLL
nr:hypothetical protein CFP56_65228 [Quercus suber]